MSNDNECVVFHKWTGFLMIWGTVAHTPAPSWVSYISHGSPAVAGSCDKRVDPGLCVSVLRSPYEHSSLSLLSLSISLFYMQQSHAKSFTCLSKLSPALGTLWVHLLYCSGGRKNNHKLYAILKVLVKITSYRGPNKHVLLQHPSLLQNTCVHVCILKILMYLWQ